MTPANAKLSGRRLALYALVALVCVSGCDRARRTDSEEATASRTATVRTPDLPTDPLIGTQVMDAMRTVREMTPQAVQEILGPPHWKSTWSDGGVWHYYRTQDEHVVIVVVKDGKVRLIDLVKSGTNIERLDFRNDEG